MPVIGYGGCSTCCVCVSDLDSLPRREPPEKHIHLSSYYSIINGTAEFHGHEPLLLTILHRAYLNSTPKGVTFNGVKHEIYSTGDIVDTTHAAGILKSFISIMHGAHWLSEHAETIFNELVFVLNRSRNSSSTGVIQTLNRVSISLPIQTVGVRHRYGVLQYIYRDVHRGSVLPGKGVIFQKCIIVSPLAGQSCAECCLPQLTQTLRD